MAADISVTDPSLSDDDEVSMLKIILRDADRCRSVLGVVAVHGLVGSGGRCCGVAPDCDHDWAELMQLCLWVCVTVARDTFGCVCVCLDTCMAPD